MPNGDWVAASVIIAVRTRAEAANGPAKFLEVIFQGNAMERYEMADADAAAKARDDLAGRVNAALAVASLQAVRGLPDKRPK